MERPGWVQDHYHPVRGDRVKPMSDVEEGAGLWTEG